MSVNYRKIMVTLDGSAFAAQALPHGASLAQKYGAKLILFQVLSDENASSLENLALDLSGFHEAIGGNRQRIRDEAVGRLQAHIDLLAADGIDAEVVVKEGKAAETIVDWAGHEDIDLIVMSTHGRSGVQRLVYGSVADKVLRGAHCPILLVRLLM